MKNILVTGGAGFIGSNFIRLMLETHDYNIINLDTLTYAGNLDNLKDIESDARYFFIKGNICDSKLVNEIFSHYEIDTVVNFAAESHVDRSIEQPVVFLQTNVIGAQTLLEAAKRHWKTYPDDNYNYEYKPGVRFLQISTDEVYGALGITGKFTETSPLLPNSPYSASKASADMIARAYHKTYGLPVIITRSSNNYGPYQFPEKLIPLMINNCRKGIKLPVYGDGRQIRDWLHVYDNCAAIGVVLHKGEPGEIYNIGGDNEMANIDVVKIIVKYLGKDESLIEYVRDRPGHDRRYALDCSRIKKQLGWEPHYTFEEGIKETINWYLENEEWVNNITRRGI